MIGGFEVNDADEPMLEMGGWKQIPRRVRRSKKAVEKNNIIWRTS